MKKTNIYLKLKKILLIIFACMSAFFYAYAQDTAKSDSAEIEAKDKGLAEYYDTQLNLPKNQVVKARMTIQRKAAQTSRLNPTSAISI